MTYAATNAEYFARHRADWVNDYDEVVAFGRDMVSAIYLVGIDGLQEYYEKPWAWDREHAWWVANGRPDTWQMWDKGIDDEFEVTGWTIKTVTTETDKIVALVNRWFDNADDGDWVGVFENMDLGHPDLGTRIGVLFSEDADGLTEIGHTTAPDSPLGPGWRYVLVAKCTTSDETLSLLMGDPDSGGES